MSSENILENNKNNENTDKNNLIKQISRNIINNFHSIKIISNISNKNISRKIPQKMKKEMSESTKISNKTLYNSLFEFHFLSNTPKQKENYSANQKTTTNDIRKDSSFKKKSNKPKKYCSKYYPVLSSYKADQTTSVQSSKILNKDKKKIISIQSKLLKKPKSYEKKYISIKNESFLEVEPFLGRLFFYNEEKKRKMKFLRQKFIEKEKSEYIKRPKILPHSLNLIEQKYNKNSLYQLNQMKEKNLDKKCNDFYIRTLKESRSCSFFGKSFNYSIEKMNIFYENKINWKKGVEKKIKTNKINIEQNQDKMIEKMTFEPSLNKKSLKMMEQKEKEKESSLTDKKGKNNHFNPLKNEGNQIENIDKFKIQLKNIIHHFYDKNDNYGLNRKKNRVKRNNTQVNVATKMNLLKKNIDNKIIYLINNKIKKISDKKQKKEENKTNINNNYDEINKYTYIQKKKRKIRKKPNKKIKYNDIPTLYKINVNPGSSWMNGSYNQINYDKKFNSIIQGNI